MIEISVIVLVYNREEKILRALSSIESQSFEDFEVIIVNDGSTDNSGSVCEDFCAKNKNWKLFNIEHIGVSGARKFGINQTSGKYISFVDSDDFVEQDFLKILHENIKNSDISICNYRVIYGNFFKTKNLLFHKKGKFDRMKVLRSLISDVSLKSFLWNKLFKRELLKNICFPDVKCYEDRIMCIQVFSRIKNCSITNKILYNYCKGSSSITWSTTEDVIDGAIKSIEFTRDFFCTNGEYNKIRVINIFFCFQVFFMLLWGAIRKYLIHEKNFSKFLIFFSKRYKKLHLATKIPNSRGANLDN